MLNSWKIIIGLAISILASSAHADQKNLSKNWNFTGKYRPDAQSLWQFDGQFHELSCFDRNDIMYENYARQHPNFRKIMNRDGIRKKWRYALISQGYPNADSLHSCFYFALISRWGKAIQNQKRDKVLFCGKIPTGLDVFDLYEAHALEEMTKYALMGKMLPITMILRANSTSHRVRLNYDIHYYLQRHLRKKTDSLSSAHDKRPQPHQKYLEFPAAQFLTRERLQWLNVTYDNEAHFKVLRTSPPCNSI